MIWQLRQPLHCLSLVSMSWIMSNFSKRPKQTVLLGALYQIISHCWRNIFDLCMTILHLGIYLLTLMLSNVTSLLTCIWHVLLQGGAYFVGVDFNHLPLWISSSWQKAKGRGRTLYGTGLLWNACNHFRPQKYSNYSFHWHEDVPWHLIMFNWYLVLSVQKKCTKVLKPFNEFRSLATTTFEFRFLIFPNYSNKSQKNSQLILLSSVPTHLVLSSSQP